MVNESMIMDDQIKLELDKRHNLAEHLSQTVALPSGMSYYQFLAWPDVNKLPVDHIVKHFMFSIYKNKNGGQT